VFNSLLTGLQVWLKDITKRGGLNGHPVRLLVYDDGGDPARHRAQAQEAVEREHVIAFVLDTAVFTGGSKTEYVTTKGIPVIGIGGAEAWVYTSPMYFPQASTGDAFSAMVAIGAARHFVPQGLKKFGTLVCSEAQGCPDAAAAFDKYEKAEGYSIVYRGRGSLAQPDFTAECLAARNAGVEVLSVSFDTNSLLRISASCARQGYRPRYIAPGGIAIESMKSSPDLEGMLVVSNGFPWFQDNTPASAEYQQAMRNFAPGASRGEGPPIGWTIGKLVERAGAQMPEPPTTAALLSGLWSIASDSLGGLTYPLTFVRDKKPTPTVCWYDLVIKNKSWVSPDGFKLSCQ
jgi:branched-chain amino acid transport system substrate-binding protein